MAAKECAAARGLARRSVLWFEWANTDLGATPTMTPEIPAITTRAATLEDVPQMCALLNEIIEIGGTTAFEMPFTADTLATAYLTGDDHIGCFVALDGAGDVAGFQALLRHDGLPQGWADIATFARARPKLPGVGAALFAATRGFAQTASIVAINATIRADNTGGLAYYDKMGFVTYAVEKGRPLQDGTPVDRISKKNVLGA